MTFQWTDEKIKEAVALYNDGHTYSEISARWGLSRSTVAGALRRSRVREAKTGKPLRYDTLWTEELIERFKTLHAEGKPYAAISEELGMSDNALRKKAVRLGLPKRAPVAPTQRGFRLPTKFGFFGAGTRKAPQKRGVVLAPDSNPVSLFERTGCCYATTEHSPHLFCNAEVNKGDYCEFHYRRMYVGRS